MQYKCNAMNVACSEKLILKSIFFYTVNLIMLCIAVLWSMHNRIMKFEQGYFFRISAVMNAFVSFLNSCKHTFGTMA
jgi:hypothetical protein